MARSTFTHRSALRPWTPFCRNEAAQEVRHSRIHFAHRDTHEPLSASPLDLVWSTRTCQTFSAAVETFTAENSITHAKTGVYAGPLRLLTHEIWDHLNKGQIIPAGVTLDPSAMANDDRGMDLLDRCTPSKPPIITKEHNDRFAGPCNPITGKEEWIVMGDASVSCTVEMLQFDCILDVAVVDEIQMIAYLARGSGWTAAVLGLCAKEVHLCGEETAMEVVKDLVKETGSGFESSRKWNGPSREIELSTSQIKQIGGCAGRYGLLGDLSDGGIVTTLYPEDLPVVKAAKDSNPPPISGAVLPINLHHPKGHSRQRTPIYRHIGNNLSQMLHRFVSSSGWYNGCFLPRFLPKFSSTLYPRQIELIKPCNLNTTSWGISSTPARRRTFRKPYQQG